MLNLSDRVFQYVIDYISRDSTIDAKIKEQFQPISEQEAEVIIKTETENSWLTALQSQLQFVKEKVSETIEPVLNTKLGEVVCNMTGCHPIL